MERIDVRCYYNFSAIERRSPAWHGLKLVTTFDRLAGAMLTRCIVL